MALYPRRRARRATRLNGLALCAGVGGLELGLHIAEPGYRTVCYVEREAYPAATLVARMADAALDRAPVWDDAKSFDGGPWAGKVDIVTAGYPCQPFTFSGNRLGEADPRHLWPDVARIIGQVRPGLVFCENVEGHISLGFPEVARDLQGMGYRVKAGLFSASEAGASHQRRRLFILAYSNRQNGRKSLRLQNGPSRSSSATLHRPDRQAGWSVGGGKVLDKLLAPRKRSGSKVRSEAADIPVFAPPPCDLQTWHQILTRRADLQPCFFGLDHGLADGLERRKAAGNGVVPLAAAIAWRTLTADMRL